VIEPDDGIAAIGSGAPYATAAARALASHTELGAREVAVAAMEIAAELCIYTNNHFSVEWISSDSTTAENTDESSANNDQEDESNG
jgi:ATP-dependent HslUV protease subunit HslV